MRSKGIVQRISGVVLISLASLAFVQSCNPLKRVVSIGILRPDKSPVFVEALLDAGMKISGNPIPGKDRFYLLGARHTPCATTPEKKAKIEVFAFDLKSRELSALPSKNAPAARAEPFVMPLEDGFVLVGGWHVEADDACSAISRLLAELGIASATAAPFPRHELVPDAFRYRGSTGEWERVPGLSGVFPIDEQRRSDPRLNAGGMHLTSEGFLVTLFEEGRPALFVPKETLVPEELPEQALFYAEQEHLPPVIGAGRLFLYYPARTISPGSVQEVREHRNRMLDDYRDFGDTSSQAAKELMRPAESFAGFTLDLRTRKWAPMSAIGAPAMVTEFGDGIAIAAAAGRRLVVFTPLSDSLGAVYDPEADRWSPISATNAPSSKQLHVVSAGEAVFVALDPSIGSDAAEGAWLYYPEGNRWQRLQGRNLEPSAMVHSDGAHLMFATHDDTVTFLDSRSGSITEIKLPQRFEHYWRGAGSGTFLVYGFPSS